MAPKRNEKGRAKQENNQQFSKNWYDEKRRRGNGISIKKTRRNTRRSKRETNVLPVKKKF